MKFVAVLLVMLAIPAAAAARSRVSERDARAAIAALPARDASSGVVVGACHWTSRPFPGLWSCTGYETGILLCGLDGMCAARVMPDGTYYVLETFTVAQVYGRTICAAGIFGEACVIARDIRPLLPRWFAHHRGGVVSGTG